MTRMTDIKNKRQAKSEEGIYSRKANVSRLMSYFRPHILQIILAITAIEL
jgi:hypothetical protein